MIEEIFAQITPEGRLSLGGVQMGHELFKQIALNEDIKDLQLNGCGINDEDFIFFLLNNKTVKRLDLDENDITIESIRYIPEHSVLEMLVLSNQYPQVTSECCQYFTNPHLKALSLSTGAIDDEGCFYLSQHKNLKALYLSDNNITDVGADYFADNKTLEKLVLGNNRLTSLSVKRFSENSTLTDLSLGQTKIEDEGAIALSQMQSLRFLNLNFSQVSNVGAIALQSLPAGEIVEIDGTISNKELLFSRKFLKLKGKPEKLPDYMNRDYRF